jgi:Glycosyltransferase family 87
LGTRYKRPKQPGAFGVADLFAGDYFGDIGESCEEKFYAMIGHQCSQKTRSRNWPRIGWQCVWAIGCIIGSLVSTQVLASENALPPYKGVRDFAAYWASARLLLAAQNPYSPAELLELQRMLGWQDAAPLVMWNPPWTFAVTLPFGLLEFESGQFLWLLLNVLLLLISARLLWRSYGERADRYRLAWFLTVTFIPTVFVLVIGQITPLVLAGLVGFLYFERQGKKFAAGAFLALAMLKPHLIYLFWLVFALWALQRRQWSLLSSAAVTGLVAATMPLLFNPSVYHQYIELFRPTELQLPLDLPAPTLRNAVKLLLETDVGALQILPSLVALIWVVFYWRRHQSDWQWSERLPLVLLVSLTTSAYAWTFDQVVFLPAIIQGASWLVRQRLPWYQSIAALLYVAIDLAHGAMRVFVAEELWYFWLAPALLVAYLIYCWESLRQL